MSGQVFLSILFHAKPERAAELGSRLNALASCFLAIEGESIFWLADSFEIAGFLGTTCASASGARFLVRIGSEA